MYIVDFHNHFVGRDLPLDAPFADLAAPEALLTSLDEAEVEARVVSTPLEFLRDDGASIAQRVNDALADLVSRHPRRLYGLASVDAYSGDAAARELERAVRSCGLRGVFMESAKGALFPDAPEARPLLSAAAALGVPVFLHPVPDPQLEARFGRFGRAGARLTRSTVNSAALHALLEGGVFEQLPGLRVVVTALAFGGLLLAPPTKRRCFHIDTTGMDPVMVRAAIDAVGADRVVMGTDWPVVREKAVPRMLDAMFDSFELDASSRRAIAGGNALRLLGVS